MLEKAAQISVVIANAGRRLREVADEFLVHQEALCQRSQIMIAQMHERIAQLVE